MRDVVGRVRLIHAIDSLSACRQIQSRSEEPVACLLQVNVAGEDTKAGVEPRATSTRFLAEVEALDRVVFHGLMTMPPLTDDPEAARPWFAALRELRDELAPRWPGRHDFRELSMGTSQDYQAAAAGGRDHRPGRQRALPVGSGAWRSSTWQPASSAASWTSTTAGMPGCSGSAADRRRAHRRHRVRAGGGQRAWPYHYHHGVEEWLLVIDGSADGRRRTARDSWRLATWCASPAAARRARGARTAAYDTA